jgi:hypothetical protein
MEIPDLTPRKDPKGGSPKTPTPPPSLRELRESLESPPEHDWSNPSSIAPFLGGRGNGTFWASWARQIIAFVFGALTAAFMIGGKSRDISDLLTWRGQMDATITRMDRDGTNASRFKVDQEQKQIQDNSAQIRDLQKAVEPIGAMQAKIERLQHDLDAKK